MARAKIKVLVVDDSALMRKHLRELLTETGEFEVAVARDGVDALELLKSVDPDVITLDINMPEMDGLTCLSRIMTEHPKPVLMVSSLTTKGAEATYEALALGAIDFIAKPDGTISLSLRTLSEQIITKVRGAAGARVSRARGLGQRLRSESGRAMDGPPERSAFIRKPTPSAAAPSAEMGVVLIGVSTGGPRVLEDILPLLPLDLPWPVLVAQHMPATFTSTFARRLDTICKLEVEELTSRRPLLPGHCYIGRGDADVVINKRGSDITAAAVPSDPGRLWHPSVGRMVESALAAMPAQKLMGVMLTGMGNDGADEMTELHRNGGRTIAEDESTAVVYGMPAELVNKGGADVVLPSHRIADQIIGWLMAAPARRFSRGAS